MFLLLKSIIFLAWKSNEYLLFPSIFFLELWSRILNSLSMNRCQRCTWNLRYSRLKINWNPTFCLTYPPRNFFPQHYISIHFLQNRGLLIAGSCQTFLEHFHKTKYHNVPSAKSKRSALSITPTTAPTPALCHFLALFQGVCTVKCSLKSGPSFLKYRTKYV